MNAVLLLLNADLLNADRFIGSINLFNIPHQNVHTSRHARRQLLCCTNIVDVARAMRRGVIDGVDVDDDVDNAQHPSPSW